MSPASPASSSNLTPLGTSTRINLVVDLSPSEPGSSSTDPLKKKKKTRRGGRKRKARNSSHRESVSNMPIPPAPTIIQRYPSSLSQRPSQSGPSRPLRPQKPKSSQQQTPTRPQTQTQTQTPITHVYIPESIDDEAPIPIIQLAPSSASSHEYSSLADLLQKAGYKETRVYTPEAEKRRTKIKTSFDDEDEEEVSALYGAFGMIPKTQKSNTNIHQRQTITEPSLPMKSSSSLLRSLALADIPDANNTLDARSKPKEIGITAQADSGWWSGGIGLAASLGRAAKAVMEMSPPTNGSPSFPGSSNTTQSATSVGLGLAKNGEGVRKVKSNWELDRSAARRNLSESPPPPQEQRPPLPMRATTDTLKRHSGFEFPSRSIQSVFNSAPPPAVEEDAFGYCPLPSDYETQCEEDVLYGTMDNFHVGSLGSSTNSRSSSEEGVDAELVLDLGSFSSTDSKDLGRRILEGAVEYDEDLDSPRSQILVLPNIDDYHTPERERPAYRRSSTTPEPELIEVKEEIPKPVLKYGDRATKLRIAQSTPNFHAHKDNSWLGSIRSAVLTRSGYAPVPTEPLPPLPQPRGPMRISPATPAAPTLVTTSPIICDSASNEAEDLPAIPPSITVTSASETPSIMPLRLRSSLAKLRSAVGLPERKAVEDDSSPVLSPRLDWKAQGSQFAGWNSDSKAAFSSESSSALEGLGLGMRVVSSATIDYTKSFFYKPATPPHPSHKASKNDEAEFEEPVSSSSKSAPKRQRSIKSLRAALLIPVAAPPVPPIPTAFLPIGKQAGLAPSAQTLEVGTPPMQPPILAISSPGAWEAGLPPRELVLEGEEWDARDGGGVPGDWGRKAKGMKRKGLRKKRPEAAYGV